MKKKKSYWTRLLRVVRQEWSRNNPDRRECFANAKCLPSEEFQKWRCANCQNSFALSEVQCDHIEAIENTIPKNLDEFLKSFHRLHSSNLQILCRSCHRLKTREDLYKKKRTEMLIRISTHLDMFPSFINQHITDGKVLKSFDENIKRIEYFSLLRTDPKSEEQFQKYYKRLNKLKEKYL